MNNNTAEDRGDQIQGLEQFCANCNVQNCNFRGLPFNNDLKLWLKQFLNTTVFHEADEKEEIFNGIINKISPLAKQFLILEGVLSLDELLKLISTQYEQLFKFQTLLSESGYLGDVVKILFDITANSKELLFNSGIENNNSFICLDNDDEFHDSFPLVNALPSDNECSEKCFSSENISEPEKQKMFKTMLSQLDVRSKNVLKRLQINFLVTVHVVKV